MYRVAVILLVACVLFACTEIGTRIPVHAEIGGQRVDTTVDSEIAQYYLEDYLRGTKSRPALDTQIGYALHGLDEAPLSGAYLKSLSRAHSTDFAALLLAQQLLREPINQAVQSLFADEFSRVKAAVGKGPVLPSSIPTDFLILFVPGWFYQSQPETGADFSMPRKVLNQAGVRTALLKTEENGTVERNASIISDDILRLSKTEKKIVIVSASKAGPEVAQALANVSGTSLPHSIKAWVNISGVLRGTALADKALTWPTRWFVKFFVISGRSFEGIESLSTERSTDRLSRARLPNDVLVLNYVGIPLSGQVTERARQGYSMLRSQGPNDGLTQIIDEIPYGSITLVELGLDHFFNHPEIHLKTVALAQVVTRLVEKGLPAAAQQGAPADRAKRGG